MDMPAPTESGRRPHAVSRGHRQITALACVVLVMAGLLLAGCTATHNPQTYIGTTLDVAYKEIESPTVVDLTGQVTGQPIDPDSPPPPTGWLIVAVCVREVSQHQYVDLGIIPKSLATSAIRAEAEKGAYNQYVDNCTNGTPRSRP